MWKQKIAVQSLIISPLNIWKLGYGILLTDTSDSRVCFSWLDTKQRSWSPRSNLSVSCSKYFSGLFAVSNLNSKCDGNFRANQTWYFFTESGFTANALEMRMTRIDVHGWRKKHSVLYSWNTAETPTSFSSWELTISSLSMLVFFTF